MVVSLTEPGTRVCFGLVAAGIELELWTDIVAEMAWSVIRSRLNVSSCHVEQRKTGGIQVVLVVLAGAKRACIGYRHSCRCCASYLNDQGVSK